MAHQNKYRGIAQLVEQRSPKPRAEGSSPSAPAKGHRKSGVFSFFDRKYQLNPRHAERVGHRHRSARSARRSEVRMAQRSKFLCRTKAQRNFGYRKRATKWFEPFCPCQRTSQKRCLSFFGKKIATELSGARNLNFNSM